MQFSLTRTKSPHGAARLRYGVVLAVVSLLFCCVLMAGAVSADVSGTPTDPYQISDVAGLRSMADPVNLSKSFVLVSDINLQNMDWIPIGNSSAPFTGTFDGDNHTISNLKIDAAEKDFQGLFGKTTTPSFLKNVRISNVAVVGNGSVGALVGVAYTGKGIENCHITGTIQITGYYKVGGLVGDGYASSIRDCTVIGTEGSFVKGLYLKDDREGDNVGGIAGMRGEGSGITIDNCTTDISVSGVRKVGGVSGIAHSGNAISNCTAKGDVALNLTGVPDGYGKVLSIGALIGDAHISSNQRATIKDSRAYGTIVIPESSPTGSSISAGLIGAVRSNNYNAPADLVTLTGMVTNSTYFISAENLQVLFATGTMSTAAAGTVSIDGTTFSLLVPGLNATGVAWTGSDADGWNLAISEPGSYRLMQDFTARNGASEAVKITVAGVTFDGGNHCLDGLCNVATGISSSVAAKIMDVTVQNFTTNGISALKSDISHVVVRNIGGTVDAGLVYGVAGDTVTNVQIVNITAKQSDPNKQLNVQAVSFRTSAKGVLVDGVTAEVGQHAWYGSTVVGICYPYGPPGTLSDSIVKNISVSGPFAGKYGSDSESNNYLTNLSVAGVGILSAVSSDEPVMTNVSISNVSGSFKENGVDSPDAGGVVTAGIIDFRDRPMDVTKQRTLNRIFIENVTSNGPAFGLTSAYMSWKTSATDPTYTLVLKDSVIQSIQGGNNSSEIALGLDDHRAGILTSVVSPVSGSTVSSPVTLEGSITGNLYENGWTPSWVGQQSGNPISVSYSGGLWSATFKVVNATHNITLLRSVAFTVESAPTKTILVTGDLSLVYGNEAQGTLTAALSDGSSGEFTWAADSSGVISLTSTSGQSITYTAAKTGTANLTVTAAGAVPKTVLVTVYNVTKPQPIEEPTVKENGNISITAASGNAITVDQNDPTKAVITDAASGAAMIITFQEPQTGGTSVEGNVTDVKVAYVPDVAVVSPQGDKVPTSASYQLNLSLSGVTATLPVISPAYNTTAAALLLGQGYTAAAMITASAPIGHDLSEINGNISTGGILLDFTVPKAWVDAIGRSKIKAFHVKNGQADMLEIISMSPDPATDPVTITVRGHEFSTIALAGFTAAPPTLPVPPVSGSGSGNSDYTFRVLFETSGGSFVQPATGLSSGGKISEPSAPTKSGYTFGGWYTDTAGTKPWDFTSGIPGDMTLYAKWLPEGSPVVPTTAASPQSTPSPAVTQTTSPAGTATHASAVSPTMTQAPAPLAGILSGLAAAGVLCRRKT